MTMMGKATEKGLEEVTKAVLAPHFHAERIAPKKVRPPSYVSPRSKLHINYGRTRYHDSCDAACSG